jgi:hypothetical protein
MVRAWSLVLEHLAEISQIERHATIRAWHEMLGLILGRLADELATLRSSAS